MILHVKEFFLLVIFLAISFVHGEAMKLFIWDLHDGIP